VGQTLRCIVLFLGCIYPRMIRGRTLMFFHYEGDFFESDTNPSYPLKHHDLLDNSDECQGCGSVVG